MCIEVKYTYVSKTIITQFKTVAKIFLKDSCYCFDGNVLKWSVE